MKLAALALVLCPTICLAVKPVNTTLTDKSCPVEINDFKTGPIYGVGSGFGVQFKNRTDKVIIGSDFGLDTMNSVGDFSPYFQAIDVADKIKPEKSGHYVGRLVPEEQYRMLPGFRVFLRKLAYSDGTVWQDDGTMRCQTVQDFRRR